MATTCCRRWQDLPFREIWCADFEFYPGAGLANGGKDGDKATVLCLVAKEMRSGRMIQLWQDELGPFSPYRLDDDLSFIAYMNSAEFGCHIALGWGQPACSVDAYVEFRHFTNDGAIKAADRDKGFHSLPGALRFFGEDGISAAHKKEMRDRIIQGPSFNADERRAILDYCREDVEALTRLVPRLIPTIRSLPHAMFRAEFMWAVAQQERRGVPINLRALNPIRSHWAEFQVDLVTERDAAYGVYEIVDGVPSLAQSALPRSRQPARHVLANISGRITDRKEKHFVRWEAGTRSSKRYASFAIPCRSCGEIR